MLPQLLSPIMATNTDEHLSQVISSTLPALCCTANQSISQSIDEAVITRSRSTDVVSLLSSATRHHLSRHNWSV